MPQAIIAAWILSAIGSTTSPFFTATSDAHAAVIAGVFSTINLLLTGVLTGQVQRVLREARRNRVEIRAAREASKHSMKELIDVKRKVSGDRRTSPARPRSGGKRSTDKPSGDS